MLKKIIIGILLVTVVGAGASAVTYALTNENNETASGMPEPLSVAVNRETTGKTALASAGELESAQIANDQDIQAVSATTEEPWQASGTITEVDDFGFDLLMEDGETAYVELGPPDFWQNQGVPVEIGQQVSVDGTSNAGMFHAAIVTLEDGQVLQVRSETGQPLWSGGVSNGQGQGDGEHFPDPQAQVDEWVTIDGELLSFQGGSMTMATSDGQVLTFQTGQPRFFADQGISFQVGDQISVLGFYEGEQFTAGEITQISTGLRVMLRDPNGRPLWGGPGNGNNEQGNSQIDSQGGNGFGGGNH